MTAEGRIYPSFLIVHAKISRPNVLSFAVDLSAFPFNVNITFLIRVKWSVESSSSWVTQPQNTKHNAQGQEEQGNLDLYFNHAPAETSPYITIIIIPTTFCAFSQHVLTLEDTASLEDAFISITQLIYHLSHCECLRDGKICTQSSKSLDNLETTEMEVLRLDMLRLLNGIASLTGVGGWEKVMMTQSLTLRRFHIIYNFFN